MKYLIIGGVAGGATTAARLRRIDEQSDIILIEKGKYISYANCGLPYYIGGVIEDRSKLFVQTPQSFSKRFNIDVRTESEVIKIIPEKKEIEIKHQGQISVEKYDKLVLSPGASPFKPSLKGIETEGIFTLRNVTDTDQIKQYIGTRKINNAVIIGAGFIGLEMAENLHHIGAKVSIVEMINQVMAPIDFSMASIVHQHLQQKGVQLHLEQAVDSFEKNENGIQVHFKSGESISADIVILSIGVRPETSLAKDAQLKLGEAGGIWVDEFLQTSAKDIYAIGDAIEFPHPITQLPWLNYLAGPANRQGRIVADNIVFGNKTQYEGSIGTSIAKVFDLTVASTGLPAKKLKQLNIPYESSTTHSGSHAGYYPDALPMSIKITFDKETGKLYGAQIVGYNGVDKRLDQIALIIKQKGTIYDLMQLEHAYAPPFSSAKDPIAIAGYVAENIMLGRVNIIHWQDMVNANNNEVSIIDVRTEDEFSLGNIVGAINIPLDDLRNHLSEIPTDKPIYIYCAIGLRGYLAARILMQNGFTKVYNLSGGYKTYQAATEPITNDIVSTINREEKDMEEINAKAVSKIVKVDACGLQCPGPILKMKKSIETIEEGEKIEMVSTDAGFSRDAAAWCNMTGNKLISNTEQSGKYTVIIEKVEKKAKPDNCEAANSCADKGKTLIVFSDDLDKALASFVLANGAAATGEKVSIFFTFWGLNVIKKEKKPSVNKDIFGKMFSFMLPSSSKALKLSKMNMFGMGSIMMRFIMKKRGIDSLESLRQQALENGVEFIACQMSMDVMGVKQEELLDEVTIGGVATYMERANKANINLFI